MHPEQKMTRFECVQCWQSNDCPSCKRTSYNSNPTTLSKVEFEETGGSEEPGSLSGPVERNGDNAIYVRN